MGRRAWGNQTPGTVRIMDAFACLLKDRQRYEEAEPLQREALVTAEQVWPEGHFLTETYRSHWGECLTAMRRFPEAEEQLLLSHRKLQEMLPEGHRSIVNRMRSLAELYEAWGKQEEASTWRAKLPKPPDESVSEADSDGE